MFVSWLDVEKERKQETCTSLSALCSLFNFQTAHGMVLVMLRLGGCVQGRGGTPLPADKRKLEGDCLGGCGERHKTRTHNQHFSLFVSKSHNSHPLSLSNCNSWFLVLLLSVSIFGEMEGERRRKVWRFPKTCFILHPIVCCWCQWSALSTYVLSLVLIAPSSHIRLT